MDAEARDTVTAVAEDGAGNLRHRARLQVDAAPTVLGKGVGFV